MKFDVVRQLIAERRAFIKPLRYEAKDGAAFPNFQLLDVGAWPVPLDLLSPVMLPQQRTVKVAAIGARQPRGWVWDLERSSGMPALPPKAAGEPTRGTHARDFTDAVPRGNALVAR
jgi:hypothetical protein